MPEQRADDTDDVDARDQAAARNLRRAAELVEEAARALEDAEAHADAAAGHVLARTKGLGTKTPPNELARLMNDLRAELTDAVDGGETVHDGKGYAAQARSTADFLDGGE